MKRLFSAALAVIMTLSLAACSGSTQIKDFTTAELSQILSTAISENSDGMVDVITTDSRNAATTWLTENKGMSQEEAKAFMDEYTALPYEDIEATLTAKGFSAEDQEAFMAAENIALSSQMIFDTLGFAPEDIEAGALSVSLINVRAYGMAVIKPAAGKEEAVLSGCQNFVALQQKSFETYLQDPYAIAKNAKCENLNGYVVMVMGENSDAIYQAISDALSGK